MGAIDLAFRGELNLNVHPPGCCGLLLRAGGRLSGALQSHEPLITDGGAHNAHLLAAAIAEHLQVGVWVLRAPDGQLAFANSAFEAMMGMPASADVTGSLHAQVYGIHDRDGRLYSEDALPFARVLAVRSMVTIDDMVIHRPDGARICVHVRAQPFFEAEVITHVIIRMADVTHEVLSARERTHGEEPTRHAHPPESVRSLTGGIAHDFNNMLAAVKILAGQLRLTETDPARVQLLTQIDDVADSAVKLTRALQNFSRRTTSRAELVSLNEVVRSIATLSQRTMQSHTPLACNLDATPGFVLGDVSQFEQVVMCLVLHARDTVYPAKTIALRTYDLPIALARTAAPDASLQAPYVAFEALAMTDAFDVALRKELFIPYESPKANAVVTIGQIDLDRVNAIVRTQHGFMEIARTHASGPMLRVCFPAADSDAPVRRSAPPDIVVVRGTGTILLVDDEPFVRASAARALKTLGYRVLLAEDGDHAVRVFREFETEIAAVILDKVLPRGGARETYLALQAIRPGVRVMLTTGGALDDEAKGILALGVRGFVEKPFDIGTLSSELARILAT